VIAFILTALMLVEAGNTGPQILGNIEGNLIPMAQLAKQNGLV
jgi:hypothetical protein